MSYDFEKLCLPCYPELIAYAAKRTKDKTSAEDIVQEAVARALGSWERWKPMGDPAVYARAFMFRVVSNIFATQYQRDKTFNRITGALHGSGNAEDREVKRLPEADMVVAELHQTDVGVHPYFKPDDIGDEVRSALERIRPEWADVVKLVYIEGTPAHEVAEILKIAPGTVRSRMARGRLALARILSPYAQQRFGFKVKPEGTEADHVAENVITGDDEYESLGGADEALTGFEASEFPQSQSYGI